ncbi:MAG: alpha/beta fold hydrolase [Armatimonadetes bacterium]|nr:alpha/beta fold hydrolase [Armatimonadota bacterium]
MQQSDPGSHGLYIHGYLAAEPCGAVVLVPPFAEEKKAAQRALVEAARALAARGCSAWTFDFWGTGDSAGDHQQATMDHWLADLRAVVEEARRAVPDGPLTLLGLRLGATLAALAADETLAVDNLVLWEPVVSGSTYMRQNRQRSQIRKELTAGEGPASVGGEGDYPASDFDGFLISGALHQGIAESDLLTAPAARCRRALVLQISGSSRLRKPLEELRDRLTEAGVETELENIAVEAFWSAIGLVDTAAVRERTASWLGLPPPVQVVTEAVASPGEVTAGVVAEALGFASGDQRCCGVLYRPADQPVERAVILLHGWSGYRVGPGRMLTEAARTMASAGLASFSFDFRGRGESEWAVEEASLNSMIRDAARAVPVVCEWTGAKAVVLIGLCSGAEVAIGASLSDPRVDHLALWSAPIFSGDFDFARRARRSRKMLADYARKLFLRETWAKLLSGRLNWRLIARAVSGGRSSEDAGVTDKAPDTSTQMQAFEEFGGRLLFIYGGNDPETAPSREFYRDFVERVGMPHAFHEIAGANHNFYSTGWKQAVVEKTLEWIQLAAKG